MHCCTQCPQSCSRPLQTCTPAKTPGHSQASLVSLSWGHCSFLLGPGVHKVLFVPFNSLFPQSRVRSLGSTLGLKGLCHIQSSYPCGSPLLTRVSTGNTQTQFCLSLCGVSGPWCHKVCLSPLSISDGYGVDFKRDFALPADLLGLLCLWTWDTSSQLLQLHAATAPALVLNTRTPHTNSLLTIGPVLYKRYLGHIYLTQLKRCTL